MTRKPEFSSDERGKLVHAMRTYVISRGARATPEDKGGYQLMLPTLAGPLRIRFEQNNPSMISAFCRFDEPQQAEQFLSRHMFNHYSGKWNFHFVPGHNLETALHYFIGSLKQVLEPSELQEVK